jgi:protein NrfD
MGHHEWGWMVVVYLFLGGLGGGCLVLGGLAHLVWPGRTRGLARAGALAAPLLVAAGAGLLVFDLGHPLRAWRLYVTVNPVSPMSLGSWLLLLFLLVGTASALLNLPPRWLEAAAGRFPRLRRALLGLAAWNAQTRTSGAEAAELQPARAEAAEPPPSRAPRAAETVRRAVALAGIPLGLAVGIYTGVLLGAIPARPFWNTPMVAQLFLFSALSTASALLMLLLPLLRQAGDPPLEDERRLLLRADLLFIFLELFILIPYIVHGELSTLSARESLGMILGGPYTRVFWVGVVALGILVPLFLELVDFSGASRRLPPWATRTVHLAVPLLLLLGGYLLRWVFVHAGQDTSFV